MTLSDVESGKVVPRDPSRLREALRLLRGQKPESLCRLSTKDARKHSLELEQDCRQTLGIGYVEHCQRLGWPLPEGFDDTLIREVYAPKPQVYMPTTYSREDESVVAIRQPLSPTWPRPWLIENGPNDPLLGRVVWDPGAGKWIDGEVGPIPMTAFLTEEQALALLSTVESPFAFFERRKTK